MPADVTHYWNSLKNDTLWLIVAECVWIVRLVTTKFPTLQTLHPGTMGPPPVVNGVSPREGPPGTKITIRGENLGISPQVSWIIIN